MSYPTTDWPTSVDGVEDRTDAVDIVWADDFDYQDHQVRQIQTWLGVTGDLLGDGIAGAGIGGAVSSIASGGNAFQLAARNSFASGKLLTIGDNYDTSYAEHMYLDSDGVLWTSGGADFSGGALRVPTVASLPSAGTAGRIAYQTSGTIGLFVDDGAAWDPLVSLFNRSSGVIAPITTTDTLKMGDGAVGGPSYTFDGENNTGHYLVGAGVVGWAIAGANPMRLSATDLYSTTSGGASIRLAAGAEATPTFATVGEEDTGMYSSVANTIEWSCGGTRKMYLDTTGLTFTSDLDNTSGDLHLLVRTTGNGKIPTSPAEGHFWYDGDDDRLKYRDNSTTRTVAHTAEVGPPALPDDDQVLWVDASSTAGTPDGSISYPYATITSALAAVSSPSITNRYTIQVRPGIYDETVTTTDDYVDIVGMDKHTTIVRQSSGSSNVLTIANDEIRISGITFDSAGTHTGEVMAGSAALTGRIEIVDCDFTVIAANTGGGVLFSGTIAATMEFTRCRFVHGALTSTIFDNTTSGSCDATFRDCYFEGVTGFRLGMDPLRVYSTLFTSEVVSGSSGSVYLTSTVDRKFYGCSFRNTASNANAFALYNSGVITDAEFTGCTFEAGASTSFDVAGNNALTAKFDGCHTVYGFYQTVVPESAVWYVGGDGDRAAFKNLNEAFNALPAATSKHVVLEEDITLTTILPSIPSGTRIVVDGQGLYTLAYGTSKIGETSAGAYLEFRDMDLTGLFVIDGNGAELRLKNVYVDGEIRKEGGDANTLLTIEGCTLVGNATLTRPLHFYWSSGSNGTVVISDSYLKGNAGSGAVYYGGSGDVVDFDGLKLFRSQIYHGSMGVNSPFDYETAFVTTVVEYAAQYCTFNQRPEDIDPGDVQNVVPLEDQFNAETTTADVIIRQAY